MPDWRAELERRLPAKVLDAVGDREALDELAQHLEDRFQELVAGGMDAARAREAVLDELRDSEQLERELAMTRHRVAPPPLGAEPRGPLLGDLWQDVRFGLRMLRKSPGFTAIAVLTLALGLGANIAIFTVINAVMLRPLPFEQPDRLVRIYESNPSKGWPTFGVSHPNYLDWAAEARAFEALAATTGAAFTTSNGTDAERVIAIAVTHRFLAVLGVEPALGRNFQPDEDRPGGNTRVAILTYAYWHRRFAGDPGVLGKTLTLTGQPYTIVGVLPEKFAWGAQAGSSNAAGTLELLVPLAPDPARARADHRLSVIGRLKADVTLDQAHADLVAIANGLEQRYPESNRGWGVRTISFYDWIIPEASRRALGTFAVAVVIVLLIACSNVASLMLARATARHREMSVRLALGARRSRVVRQLLVESILLSLIAGAVGLGIAFGAAEGLKALSPGNLPRIGQATVDVRGVLFGLAASIVTGLLFGLVPALTGLRFDVTETLRETGRGGGAQAGRQRLPNALVIGELALSVALLVGAGMLLRSFWQVQKVDPGFDTARLLTMQINLPGVRYDSREKAWGFYERLLGDLAALPGVNAVAMTSGVPMSPGNTSTGVKVPGRPEPPEGSGSADWRIVGPGYFRTMGIPLRGREFTVDDIGPEEQRPRQQVTIVSESMAERYWPGQDAVGQSVILPSAGPNPLIVIGVARDVRSFGLDAIPAPMVYFPTPSAPGWNPMSIVLRTAGEPNALAPSARGVLRSIDPDIPFYNVTTAEELLAASMGPRRFTMFLTTAFAAVALVLAAVGLFGVMAYLVTQRVREIGIRLALGARPRDVFRSVLGRGAVLALAGAGGGIAAAYWLTPLMQSLLFDVKAFDAVTFAGAPMVLVAVALLACYLPARRAMGIDPLAALREE